MMLTIYSRDIKKRVAHFLCRNSHTCMTIFVHCIAGILADDMGLGKTLQTIALIMTNFKDGKPLAVPVPGKIRQSKILRMQQKAQVSHQRCMYIQH